MALKCKGYVSRTRRHQCERETVPVDNAFGVEELQTKNDFSGIKPEGRKVRVHRECINRAKLTPPLSSECSAQPSAKCTHSTLCVHNPSVCTCSFLPAEQKEGENEAELASGVSPACS